jgi:hypothetical protein
MPVDVLCPNGQGQTDEALNDAAHPFGHAHSTGRETAYRSPPARGHALRTSTQPRGALDGGKLSDELLYVAVACGEHVGR